MNFAPTSGLPDQQIEQRELLLRRLWTPPWLTLSLVGLLVLIFVWTEPWRDSSQFGDRVLFGAFVGELFESGEIYRLVTANFLHQGWPHLINNMTTLLFFGWLVEASIGAKRTVVLLFFAGVVGYALIVPLTGLREEFPLFAPSGSSAAIWGLLGASIVLTTRNRRDLPVAFPVLLIVWAMIVAQLIFQMRLSVMSIAAHLGGGVTGVLAMAYLARNGRVLPPHDAPRLTPMVAAVAITVVVAGVSAVRNDSLHGKQRYFALVHQQLASSIVSDTARNNFAWILAVANSAPQQSMRLALDVMQGVVARDPIVSFRDTLATLYYRTGEPGRAVEIARAIWWQEPDVWAVTQLARFYAAAHHEGSADTAEGNEWGLSADAFAKIDVIRLAEPDSFEFAIRLAELEPAPALIHALVYRAGELHSLLELDVDWILRGGRCDFRIEAILGLDLDTLSARAVWYGSPDSGAVSVVTTCRLQTLHSDARLLP